MLVILLYLLLLGGLVLAFRALRVLSRPEIREAFRAHESAKTPFGWPLLVGWVVLLSLPVVVVAFTTPPRQATAEKPAPREISAPVRVELLAVAPHPSRGKAWWKADGSAFTDAVFEFRGQNLQPQDNEQVREFAFSLQGPEGGAHVWRFEPNSRSVRIRPAAPPNSSPAKDVRIVAAILPKDAQMANIKVGMDLKQWEFVAEYDVAKASQSSPSDWQVTFDAPIEADGTTTVAIVHANLDRRHQVVAVDEQGREQLGNERSIGSAAPGFTRQVFAFPGLPLKRIRSLRFEGAIIRWFEFKNVALKPAETVQPPRLPKISVEAPANATGATFGPVIERTIYDYRTGKEWLLNLDTGEMAKPPDGLDWDKNSDVVWDWAAQRGLNLTGLPIVSQRGLYGFQLSGARLDDATFETATAAGVRTALEKGVKVSAARHGSGPWLAKFGSAGKMEEVYAFRTRFGAEGLLQMLGPAEKSYGIKLRYKLVQPAGAEPWGPLTEGLQVRAKPLKRQWTVDETPMLTLELRNFRGQPFRYLTSDPGQCRVEMDGQRYIRNSSFESGGTMQSLASGDEGGAIINVHLSTAYSKLPGAAGTSGQPGEELRLTPGKHTVRLLFRSASGEDIEIVSNAVEIEIFADANAPVFRLAELNRELKQIRNKLQAILETQTPEHPMVKELQEHAQALEKEIEKLKK